MAFPAKGSVECRPRCTCASPRTQRWHRKRALRECWRLVLGKQNCHFVLVYLYLSSCPWWYFFLSLLPFSFAEVTWAALGNPDEPMKWPQLKIQPSSAWTRLDCVRWNGIPACNSRFQSSYDICLFRILLYFPIIPSRLALIESIDLTETVFQRLQSSFYSDSQNSFGVLSLR